MMSRGRPKPLRRLRQEERGLTVVEGVVACLLLVLGSLAVMQVFDTATRTTFLAEERQALNNRLQAELEEVMALSYGKIAMSELPVASTDQNDPRWRVNGSNYALNRDGSGLEPLVVDATAGVVSPTPEPFTVGDITGEIFKFVVWRDDPNCSEALCPGEEDIKRVVVAATVNEAPISFDRAFQEIHGESGDPDATPVNNPAADDPNNPNAGNTTGEFWLTDTPCGAPWERLGIVEDPPGSGGHPLHNTRGVCDDGLKTSTSPGAPDLMFNEAVPLDESLPADGQPLYDYSSNISPQGEGRVMPRPSTNGCLLDGGTETAPLLDFPSLLGESDPHTKVHKWVSPPLPQNFELLLLGTGTLNLYTRTLGGATHPGKICIWLYIRQVVDGVLVDVPIDTPVVSTENLEYFEHAENPWPPVWTAVPVPLSFVSPPTLVAGEQIGLAITVERGGTDPGQGLEFMYDHPSFESRLQLEVDRVLPLSW